MDDKLQIVYIAGIGRNGSTLLGRILGEHKDCLNVGEAISYMLNSELRDRHQNESTGINVKISESPFWSAVFTEAGFNSISSDLNNLLRESNFNKLNLLIEADDKKMKEIIDKLEKFFLAIQKVSGKKVIVDTSKLANIPLFLKAIPGIDVFIIHLIRDPVSVVASRSKVKQYLSKEPFFRMIYKWIIRNKKVFELKSKFNYYLINYESFCENPHKFMNEILHFINLNPAQFDALKNNEITLHSQDILAGNPDKYKTGKIKIKKSNQQISFWKYWIIKLITFPAEQSFKNYLNLQQPIAK